MLGNACIVTQNVMACDTYHSFNITDSRKIKNKTVDSDFSFVAAALFWGSGCFGRLE